MNPLDSTETGSEAVIEYQDGDFSVIKPGGYVCCAVTGARIPLQALRYWNVDRQEAYVNADAALVGHTRKPNEKGNA